MDIEKIKDSAAAMSIPLDTPAQRREVSAKLRAVRKVRRSKGLAAAREEWRKQGLPEF